MPIKIVIPAGETWDYNNDIFITTKQTVIHIEHSLASIAKWEGKYKKPFINQESLPVNELITYVKCMTLEDLETIDPNVYLHLSAENFTQINNLLADSRTATTFKDDVKGKRNKKTRQIMTAEIFYYYMVELGIPFECENWNFNRLLALIRVCSEKQAVPKKMAKKDIFSQNAALNAQRRARLGSKG